MAQDSPSRTLDKIVIRVPDGLRDRIAETAKRNGRSMNAEVVAALEEKYPPDSINVEVLAKFLESLAGISAPDGNKKLQSQINDMLAKTDLPWTVEAGWDGAVTFYPYATKPKSAGKDEITEKGKIAREKPE